MGYGLGVRCDDVVFMIGHVDVTRLQWSQYAFDQTQSFIWSPMFDQNLTQDFQPFGVQRPISESHKRLTERRDARPVQGVA